MRLIRGQMSPGLARRLQQWAAPARAAIDGGVDVLPPELRVQLANLRKPAVPGSQQEILDHSKYGFFNNLALNVGLASQLILRQSTTTRIFLFFVNTHATQTLFLRFGGDANAIVGVPIAPANGFIGFDTVVPQDDIYMIANGAATTGVGLYSNKDN